MHDEYRITWREFSRATGVSGGTLRGWLKGALPSVPSFGIMMDRLVLAGILDVEVFARLTEGYSRSINLKNGAIQKDHADIAALIKLGITKISDKRPDDLPPAAPEQTSPGPTLKPTSSGFDIQISPPPEAERDDPEIQRLHQQLRRLADHLAASMPRISNTHKELADQFAAYAAFLAPDLEDIDITSFWAVGTGLGAHIRALNRASPNVMTPELEPALMAQFETLMAVHAAFILGFSAAREMQARIAQSRAAAQDDPEQPMRVLTVLTSMLKTPHLLAEKARVLVDALAHGIPAAPDAVFDLLAGRYETARNGTHAFMRALHPIIEVSGVVGLVSFGNAALSGEQVDLMLTTGTYISAHMQEIMALFQNDQITTDWLRWAHKRLERKG